MDWLPELICYDDDWCNYLELLYQTYIAIYRSRPPIIFSGQKVTAPRQPEYNGRSEAFWHIIGGTSNTPEIPRCERLCWARAIIEHSDDDGILIWEEYRGSQRYTLLWAKEVDYLVVLIKRSNYYLLRTAYVVKAHKRRSLQRAYDTSKQQASPDELTMLDAPSTTG